MMKEDFDIAVAQTTQISEQERAEEPAHVVKCQREEDKKPGKPEGRYIFVHH